MESHNWFDHSIIDYFLPTFFRKINENSDCFAFYVLDPLGVTTKNFVRGRMKKNTLNMCGCF